MQSPGELGTAHREELRRLLGQSIDSPSARSANGVDGGPEAMQAGSPEVLRHSNSRAVVVFVAGGAAGIRSYRKLAELLSPEATLVVSHLRTENLDFGAEPSVNALAELHLQTILSEFAGNGIFTVVGHSLAGSVSVEICRGLQKNGKEVASAIIIDQPGPGIRVSLRQWLAWQWTALSHLPRRQRRSYISDGIRFRLISNRWIPRVVKKWVFPRGKPAAGSGVRRTVSANEFRMRTLDGRCGHSAIIGRSRWTFPCC